MSIDSRAPLNLLSRSPLSRLVGVLVTLAVLLLAFPATAAPGLGTVPGEPSDAGLVDAPLAPPSPTPGLPEAAERALSATEVPDEAPETPIQRPDIRTGDILDAEERAAFQAYIDALKERGTHRGHAFY